MNNAPFMPLSKTFLLVADATSPTGIQPVVTTGLGTQQYHIVNTGTQIVYLSYASTADLAQSGAVIPTGGSPQTVIPILPNNGAIYTLPAGSFISGITPAAGATNIMITLGEGA